MKDDDFKGFDTPKEETVVVEKKPKAAEKKGGKSVTRLASGQITNK
jgi:hypothetical protein